VNRFVKHPVGHELHFARLELVGAEDAIGVAEIRQLQVQFEGPEGHSVQCFAERIKPADARARFAPEHPDNFLCH